MSNPEFESKVLGSLRRLEEHGQRLIRIENALVGKIGSKKPGIQDEIRSLKQFRRLVISIVGVLAPVAAWFGKKYLGY